MEVYLEYAILDNFIIDFILLKISYKCARVRTSKLRLIIASIVGTVFAILVPLINLKVFVLFPLKVLVGILIVYLGAIFSNFKHFLLSSLYFFTFTFLSGGVIIAIFNLALVDYSLYFSINYDSVLPIGICFLIIYIFTNLLLFLIKNFVSRLKSENFIRKCEIVIKGRKIIANGFIDSGNKLYDNLTGLPVILASNAFISKLLINKIMPNKYRNLKVSTVNGESTIKIYKIEKLKIYNGVKVNIYNNVLLGEARYNFDEVLNYELLLHSSLN